MDELSPRNESPRSDVNSPRCEFNDCQDDNYELILDALSDLTKVAKTNRKLLESLSIDFDEQFTCDIQRCVSRLDAVVKNSQLCNQKIDKIDRNYPKLHETVKSIRSEIEAMRYDLIALRTRLDEISFNNSRPQRNSW